MRYVHNLVRVALSLAVIIFMLPGLALAQSGQATLVARAILPAATFAQGPQAAQAPALANRTNINGLKVPFDSQPVGGFVTIGPGQYPGDWFALSDGTFDTPQNSGDYLLRIYSIQLSWATANGGDGTVSVNDWVTLSDPAQKAGKTIHNSTSPKRELTGADFSPRAGRKVDDGTVWIAESIGPSLLHFNGRAGELLDAPIPLGGGGTLGGLAVEPDGKTLLIAQRNGQTVTLRAFDTNAKNFGSVSLTFPLVNSTDTVSGLTMINDHQALIIEEDNQEGNAAKFKQVFLLDLSAKPVGKTLLVDLLKINDSNNISNADAFPKVAQAIGLGQTFKFPYKDVSSVYPEDGQTLIIVNDNHVPYGLGRSPKQADDTDFIAVQLSQSLNLDPKFALPH